MIENRYINSDKVRLYTVIKGNERSNKVIITLHGGPGSGAKPLMDSRFFKKLEEDYLIVYFDQRGCGKSTYDLENKICKEDLVYDVHRMVEYVKERFSDKELCLFGGSFGGFLGFLFLRYYPNEVQKYIACCPGIYFSDEGFEKNIKLVLNHYKGRFNDEFDKVIKEGSTDSQNVQASLDSENFKEYIFSSKCKSISIKYHYAIADWFPYERMGSTLENIEIPVLVIQGIDDEWVSYKNIKEGIKEYGNNNISLIVYEKCGHEIWNEKCSDLYRDITKFIE